MNGSFYDLPYRFHLKPGIAFMRPRIKKQNGRWKVIVTGDRHRDNCAAWNWCAAQNRKLA
jgi:hypothetical protein